MVVVVAVVVVVVMWWQKRLTSLSVCEESDVGATEQAADQRLGHRLVHLLLRHRLLQHAIAAV